MDFDSATMLELIARIQFGDRSAYTDLVCRAGERLELLVRRMLARYPDVARWEQVEDVLQGAHRRLWAALREVTPASTRSFANLAAQLIQRELIDLARHYRGPGWLGASRESTPMTSPGRGWTSRSRPIWTWTGGLPFTRRWPGCPTTCVRYSV